MKIDDCESLKKWLVQVLTPMFDGDPEKLALYIVALAKKVDNDLSSRQRCIEDLEVFLEAQTNAFVNQLFDALVNKTYTTATTTTTAASTPVVTAPAATVAPVEQQPRVQQTTPTSRSSNQRPSRTDHYHSHDSKSSSGYYNRRSDGRGRSRSNERRRGGGGGRNRSRGGRNRGGSSSSSSSSPSPVRRRSRSRSGGSRSRSRSRSPFYRSDKSRNSDSYASKDTRTVVPSSNNGNETSTAASGGKRQRCRDYDEKGFCTAGEFCPYEHSNAVVAPIPGSSSTTLPQSQYQNRPYQKRSKSSYQPKYRNNQPQQQQQQPTSSDMFNQPPPQQQRPIIGMNPLMGNRPRNLVELTAASSQAFDDPSTRNAPVKRSYTAEFNLQIAPPGYNNNNNTALLPTPPPTNLIQPPANIITNQPPPSSFIPPPKNLNYTPSFPTTNAPLPSGDQFNSSLVVRRIPVEMNRVENLSQHFAQFGPIVDIQCAFESNSDAALVVFGNNQAAQAAFKCPQPVFNNRFIRLYWLPHHLKMTRPQQQQQQSRQQHQQQHSAQFTSPSNLNQSSTTDQEMTQRPGEDQPPQMGTKRPARDRLSYGNKPYEMTVTKPNEFPNKENQQQQKFPPEEITKTIYNPNATKTVDNQPSESSMDLTTETQPQQQQQQQQIDFSQLSLKTAALEANKPQPKSSIAMARQIESENQKKVLMLKLEVQRKARELMEKQIKDQKVLLEKFEKAKTPEEKSQIYALIKKISEAIEKEKEILNESPSGGGVKAKVDSTHSRVVPAAPHLLKLNNKRLNTTSFLKGVSGGALSPKTVAAAAQQPASPSASSAAVSAFFNYSKVSVDNRPKKILFSGINTQNEKTNIVNFISTLGVKIDSVDQIAGSSDSASTEASTEQTVVPFSIVLTFATRKDAEFALTKCSASLTSKRIKIAWYRPEQEQQQQSQNQQQQQQQQETEKQSNQDNADIEAEMKPNESFDNAANNSLESSINKPSGEETSNEQQPQQGDHQIEMVPVTVNNNDENIDVFEDLFTN